MNNQDIALGIARSHMDDLRKAFPQIAVIKSFAAVPLPRMEFFNSLRESLGWAPIPTSAIECHIMLYLVESGQYIMDVQHPWSKFYSDMLHDFSKGMVTINAITPSITPQKT